MAKLKVAWTYDARADTTPPPARNRASETSPLVVGGILYIGTPYNHIVALEPETGKKIWDYAGDAAPSTRGINYWPGDKLLAPQIVVTTMNGTLCTLNAKTGKLNPGFGDEGKIDLRKGVADKFPKAHYGTRRRPRSTKTSSSLARKCRKIPPTDRVETSGHGTSTPENSSGHSTPFRAPVKPTTMPGGKISGKTDPCANAWGLMTVDTERGMLFLPLGTPTPDFYGGSRKGSNLYGSSLVALDAATGKLKWYFQTTHHDNWDYD